MRADVRGRLASAVVLSGRSVLRLGDEVTVVAEPASLGEVRPRLSR